VLLSGNAAGFRRSVAGSAIIEHDITYTNAISKLPRVKSVVVVTGCYDLLVEVYVEPYNIIKFLSTELAKIDSIVSIESFIALHCVNKFV